ncbi:hypothetical protein [Halorientalis pallida]|uniref:Uncharacterized protein n=1 Tax=Halorientalis pallida TaxID=2479928 RepID=A0A498KZ11_9EURY|nr:hypothetical protein [Halorientalis pallida]RXK51309.1 hypothetical protein EAF64_01310 [Halorientalis pallida]
MSRASALGPLATVFAHLPCSRDGLTRLLGSVGLTTDPPPVREPAMAAHAPARTGHLPPFETITLAEQPTASDDCAPSHGVTVWNAGPTRTVTVAVESAGQGDLLETERTLDPNRPLRIELGQADAYTVAVGDGDLLYEVSVEPEWFDRDAAVTDVVVDDDGGVRYSTLAE